MKRQKLKGMQQCIMLDKVPLKHLIRFKYLGSWITEDARSDEDIRARVEMDKTAFGEIENYNEKQYQALYKDEDTELLCILGVGLWV